MNITNEVKEKNPINIIENDNKIIFNFNKIIKTIEKEKANQKILYNKSKKYRHYYKFLFF